MSVQRSCVWRFFENAGERATCRLCAKSFVHRGGTTSNLLKHLTSQHPTQRQATKEQKEEGDTKIGVKTTGTMDMFVKKMTCPSARAGQLTSALVDFVALDLRPVSTVCGVGFRRLLNVCEPGYRVPSATHVASLLQKKHSDGKKRLVDAMRSACGVSLTTDAWTSRAMGGYITTTAHFIDSAWVLRSFVLSTAGNW